MNNVKQAVSGLVLAALGVIVALLVAEIALRAFGQVDITTLMFVEDDYTICRNKPQVKGRAIRWGIYDYSWTTNSNGFRASVEYPVPKPPNTQRVLVLGDSFTFGIGVNDAETYSARLEKRLTASCGRSHIEVINAGVGGFNTSQELEFLERYGLVFDPDMVVLGFYVNDPLDNVNHGVHLLLDDELMAKPLMYRRNVHRGFKRLANAIPGYEFLTSHSALVNWLRQLYFRFAKGGETTGDQQLDQVSQQKSEPNDTLIWHLTEYILSQMKATVESNGSRLLVVLIPSKSDLQKYISEERREATTLVRIQNVCANLELECLDLAAWLVNRGAQDTSALYFQEGHFTALAHELTAEAIYERLSHLLDCP